MQFKQKDVCQEYNTVYEWDNIPLQVYLNSFKQKLVISIVTFSCESDLVKWWQQLFVREKTEKHQWLKTVDIFVKRDDSHLDMAFWCSIDCIWLVHVLTHFVTWDRAASDSWDAATTQEQQLTEHSLTASENH